MKVYFITRFSIFDPAFGGFRITKKKDPIEYKKELFDRERLDFKFEVFERVTFPSIINQTFDDWEWIIYTSDQLPLNYMCRLKDLIKNHSRIVIFTVKDFKEFFDRTETFNYKKPFATVRIDDDDALNKNFAEKLQVYANNWGNIISFTEGSLGKYRAGHLIMGQKISEKNNAQGLAAIGINIYSCGRHSDIHLRYNVIYDNSPGMFILTCSPFTDTKRGFSPLERNMRRIEYLANLAFSNPSEVPNAIVNFLKKNLQR